jgi:hypothetical protein
MREIEIDPKMFISPPYRKCPKCGKPDTFGTLMVNDDSFTRRCSDCWHTDSIPLPELNKTVIYIDQFAISNMMKVLNTRTKANNKGRVDAFWRILFEKLDRLCKLQLIICLDSYVHTNESLMTEYFKDLERMYELLSHGVTFHDQESIKAGQLYEHAFNWISGSPEKALSLNIHDVVYGKINAWQSRFNVSVNMRYQTSWIENMRKSRNFVHAGMAEVFKKWQSEKGKPFNYFFENECKEFIRELIAEYLTFLERWQNILQCNSGREITDVIPPSSYMMIEKIHEAFGKVRIQEQDVWDKTMEYLGSNHIQNIPFVKISAMLFASIARKAAAGQMNPPGQGMLNDISIISVILPYCDAIFIDKECHAYLREKPLCDEISYETKIFSLSNKNDFLEYLDSIEKGAAEDHLFRVSQAYGDNWSKPYKTLYSNEE